MKRKLLKKSLWNVWIFDSHPITKRNVFSLLSFLFQEKNDYDSGKLKFLCFGLYFFGLFFVFLVNEQTWFGLQTWKPLILSLSIVHLSSSVYYFVLHPFFSLSMAECLSPDPVEDAASIHSSWFFFFICFISISICMAGDEMAAVSFDRYHRLILPSFVWFLYFHSKHISPSIFLFFLNVIVKCSSEMTLNMCTLTEGIHLVIYFLIPVLRGLFAALPPGVLVLSSITNLHKVFALSSPFSLKLIHSFTLWKLLLSPNCFSLACHTVIDYLCPIVNLKKKKSP